MSHSEKIAPADPASSAEGRILRLGAARPRFSDMERRGTGFGLVMLVVVMAVVLLLYGLFWSASLPLRAVSTKKPSLLSTRPIDFTT